jgi:hypothetical protein
MTDMEFIYMRQAEGRAKRPNAPTRQSHPASRVAALMRFARRSAGSRRQ